MPTLSNATYDRLNRVVKIGLPALGTFYFTIAQIFGLPAAEQVLAAVAALATLLGVLLSISKKNYTPETDGDLVWDDNEATYALRLNDLPDSVNSKDHAVLKVINH